MKMLSLKRQNSAFNAMIILLSLMLSSPLCAAGYSSRRQDTCQLATQSIVLLSRNADSGTLSLVQRLPSDTTDALDTGNVRRHLSSKDLQQWRNQKHGARSDEIDSAVNFLRRHDSGDMANWDEGVVTNVAAAAVTTSSDNRMLARNDGNFDQDGNPLYYARECGCLGNDPVVYCPFAASTCNRPFHSSNKTLPGCLHIPKSNSRARSWFFYVLIMYPVLIMSILLTPSGRHAISYVISWIPGWNLFRVNYIMEKRPRQANGLIRNYVLRNQRLLEQRIQRERRQEERQRRREQRLSGSTGQTALNTAANQASANATQPDATQDQPTQMPTSLALRTGIFEKHVRHSPRRRPSLRSNGSQHDTARRRLSFFSDASHNNPHDRNCDGEDDDDNTDTQCTICFVPLEDGDRIGLLSCKHVFHVDCLKMWLQRRNVCPLCQATDIAEPRFDDKEASQDPLSTTELDSTTAGDPRDGGDADTDTSSSMSPSTEGDSTSTRSQDS